MAVDINILSGTLMIAENFSTRYGRRHKHTVWNIDDRSEFFQHYMAVDINILSGTLMIAGQSFHMFCLDGRAPLIDRGATKYCGRAPPLDRRAPKCPYVNQQSQYLSVSPYVMYKISRVNILMSALMLISNVMSIS